MQKTYNFTSCIYYHIEVHYMWRTHLPPSVLIATVFPGHFAEASVMHFNMVDSQGIEPRMPEAPDLQSGVVTNATRYPKNLTKDC
jgi:hypothetical protein